MTDNEASAPLTQPEPEGPTLDCDEIDVPAWHRGDDFYVYKEGYTSGWAAGLKAAADCWGRPTIKPVPAPMSADTLAAIIREVQGRRRLGAAALAEAILAHPAARNAHPRTTLAQPEPEWPPMPVPGDAEGLAEVFWGRCDQPEPEGLTDKELLEAASKALGYVHIRVDSKELEANGEELIAYARAVLALARWGRPAIQPVAVAEDQERLRIMEAGIRYGYKAGHHDTVEACYGDPDDLAADYAPEILEEMQS
jgi:hypothetical protein